MHSRIAERAQQPRYTISEGATFVGLRHRGTIRRWALGHDRSYQGEPRRDDPLIRVDGDPSSRTPLSFLNLLELRFLASYRQNVPLQSIRRALDWTGKALNEERPLLTVEFKARGRDLFLKFASEGTDEYFLNASGGGQMAWPEALDEFMEEVDYEDGAARRWWPLGRQELVVIDTLVNGGRPSTASSGVRTIAIAAHSRGGLDPEIIAKDVGATPDEVRAALRFEHVAA